MTQFPFEWQVKQGISNLKINDEWSLKCLWGSPHDYNSGYYTPRCLEIRRNSTAGDILVSGNFSLSSGVTHRSGRTSLHQQKFSQLIEAGFASTEVEIKNFSLNSYAYSSPTFTISGTLTIPANVAHKETAKGVNFDSLLVLSSDFERLLDPKVAYFSDVNLKCGTVSFSVHKVILSARSPVFAAMFATEMKENRKNKVDISDLCPSVLKTMLTYIYTGKTGALSVQSAGELLFAGDKYQLQDLKKVCSDYLKSSMSVENVLKTLVLGYLHDKELKDFAIDFICNSCEEFEVLEKTVEWKNLREKIPSLAMEVLTHLVKSKDEKLKWKK